MPIHLCPYCDAQLSEQARFCSSCGGAIAWPESTAAVEAAPAETDAPQRADLVEQPAVDPAPEVTNSEADPLPVPENIAAVISYATVVPAIVFLFVDPFRRNRFVRFHAMQHLLLFGAAVVCAIAAAILWTVFQLIPPMRVLVFPFVGLISLAWFFLWLLLLVKAYHHEMFKLPWIGDYAEQWSLTH